MEQAATPATAVSKRRQKVSAIQIEIYQSTHHWKLKPKKVLCIYWSVIIMGMIGSDTYTCT